MRSGIIYLFIIHIQFSRRKIKKKKKLPYTRIIYIILILYYDIQGVQRGFDVSVDVLCACTTNCRIFATRSVQRAVDTPEDYPSRSDGFELKVNFQENERKSGTPNTAIAFSSCRSYRIRTTGYRYSFCIVTLSYYFYTMCVLQVTFAPTVNTHA